MQKIPHYHTNRVNEDIARELMYILQNVKDPRVSKSFVSVTKTETTPDLKYCKIYYSNYIRRELSSRLALRNTPELSFIKDTGAEHGARISELLKEIEAEAPEESEKQESASTENE